MMGRMKAIPLLLLCAALASGCVVSKRVDGGGRGPGGDYGMLVDVWRDGTLSYKGRKVSREKLVRELREDAAVEVKGRPGQRAVILEAQRGDRTTGSSSSATSSSPTASRAWCSARRRTWRRTWAASTRAG